MRLLATLPALASFSAHSIRFERGSAETLRQWREMNGSDQERSAKRKADQLTEDDGDDDENVENKQGVESQVAEDDSDEGDEMSSGGTSALATRG